MTFTRNPLPILALILIVVLAGSVAFLFQNDETASENVGTLRRDMQDLIAHSGPENAYVYFKSSNQDVEPDLQHNISHIFGESLYTALGGSGVAVCDAEFNFGCYHGFFTAAIKAEGEGSVAELDRVCQASSRASACQHGLGHGILEYLGHKKLDEALEMCRLTNQPDPVAGCTSGVFMEYNVPLIVNGSTYRVTARPLGDPEQPFAPCTEIGEKFRTSCYHELPQWWNQVYSGSFERMGVLCASVVQPEQRRNCFAGIGNIAGSVAGYDADAVIALCGKMPDTGRDTCLLNAAWSFTANVNEPESALHVCKEISEASRQRCIDSL